MVALRNALSLAANDTAIAVLHRLCYQCARCVSMRTERLDGPVWQGVIPMRLDVPNAMQARISWAAPALASGSSKASEGPVPRSRRAFQPHPLPLLVLAPSRPGRRMGRCFGLGRLVLASGLRVPLSPTTPAHRSHAAHHCA